MKPKLLEIKVYLFSWCNGFGHFKRRIFYPSTSSINNLCNHSPEKVILNYWVYKHINLIASNFCYSGGSGIDVKFCINAGNMGFDGVYGNKQMFCHLLIGLSFIDLL